MPTITPLQRAFRVMPTWKQSAVPKWIEDASSVERAGLAQHEGELLERFSLLSPFESLVSATNSTPERQQRLIEKVESYHSKLNAAYLAHVVSPAWSLGTDPYWKALPPEAQLLIARYAVLTKNVLRPKRSGDVHAYQVWDVLKSGPESIYRDPFLHSVAAYNNPALLDHMVHSKEYVAQEAIAIGFFNRHGTHRSMYESMDGDTFAALIMYDKAQPNYDDMFQRVLDKNRTLHRYPWDKLPILLEHHPARFIQSVVANFEVANSRNHTQRWFVPMLMAAATRAATDPSYMECMLGMTYSRVGKKRFYSTIETHAPEQYAMLSVARQLYDPDVYGNDTSAVKAWLINLATMSHGQNMELAHLNTSVFETTSPSVP